MKNIYSNIFSFNKKILSKTINYLKAGKVIGMPTETVYGLAGNAYSKKAISKIFKVKNRPKINPLIVHYANYKKATEDVIFNENFFKLYKKFCPGPLTFILNKKRKSKIQPMTSANLKTIAVRFPSHKISQTVLKSINFPLAMPSANLSGSISPICAKDVAEELKKKITLIIDGKNSKIGIESTVIDLTRKPKILRKGIIDAQAIKKIVQVKYSKEKSNVKSPGMLYRHYSPGIPMKLGQTKTKKNAAFITFGRKYSNHKNYFNLSKNSDLKEAASNLYKIFRKIKKLGFKKINVVKIPNRGPGIAINDRLKKASR